MKRAATAAEQRHMDRVQALGCIVCSDCLGIHGTPAIIHHLRTGQEKMRAPHSWTLPICPTHHQHSGQGIHDMGRDQFEHKYGISEVQLLIRVMERIGAPVELALYELDQRFSLRPLATEGGA